MLKGFIDQFVVSKVLYKLQILALGSLISVRGWSIWIRISKYLHIPWFHWGFRTLLSPLSKSKLRNKTPKIKVAIHFYFAKLRRKWETVPRMEWRELSKMREKKIRESFNGKAAVTAASSGAALRSWPWGRQEWAWCQWRDHSLRGRLHLWSGSWGFPRQFHPSTQSSMGGLA